MNTWPPDRDDSEGHSMVHALLMVSGAMMIVVVGLALAGGGLN